MGPSRGFLDPGFLRRRRLAQNRAEDAAEWIRAVDGAGAGGIVDGYGRLSEFDELIRMSVLTATRIIF